MTRTHTYIAKYSPICLKYFLISSILWTYSHGLKCLKTLLIQSVESKCMSKLPCIFQKCLWRNKGPGVVMERQKDRKKRVTKMWQKPSILVLKISRKLNEKETIRQQFGYLNIKILNCKATVPFIWYCSFVREKKEWSFAEHALLFIIRCLCDSRVVKNTCIQEGLSLSFLCTEPLGSVPHFLNILPCGWTLLFTPLSRKLSFWQL